jgi:hypothetical protein
MSWATLTGPIDTATLLRRGLLLLAAVGIAGTGVELVFLRHWSSPTQLIVWPALVLLITALVLIARARSPRAIRVALGSAAAVLVVAALGVAMHVIENLAAGPLDRNYASQWQSMSLLVQLWTATTGGVGPAPVLAPAALAEISLALVIATLRHPALSSAMAGIPD